MSTYLIKHWISLWISLLFFATFLATTGARILGASSNSLSTINFFIASASTRLRLLVMPNLGTTDRCPLFFWLQALADILAKLKLAKRLGGLHIIDMLK